MKTQDEEEAERPVTEVTSPSAGTSEQTSSSPMHQRRIESVRVTSLTCCSLLCMMQVLYAIWYKNDILNNWGEPHHMGSTVKSVCLLACLLASQCRPFPLVIFPVSLICFVICLVVIKGRG